MKAMVTPSQQRDGGVSGMFVPWWACRSALIRLHSSHPAMYFRTVASFAGQWKSRDTNSAVLRAPK
jgi:hypothetical protein